MSEAFKPGDVSLADLITMIDMVENHTDAIDLADKLWPMMQARPPAQREPVAWQCIDERHEFRYIKGIVTVDKETVEAWKDGGLAFVALGPIGDHAEGSTISPSDLIRIELRQCMMDCWNAICADTDCHPLDIKHRGKKLFFEPDHWADMIAFHLADRLSHHASLRDLVASGGVLERQSPAECADEAFASLRQANEVRQREWDTLGQLTLAYRGNELAGEVGEACNVIKKLERERLGINGSRDTVEHLAEELADVIICTDLIAMQAGIDLNAAVVAKFNASSEKVGLKTRMTLGRSSQPDIDKVRHAFRAADEIDWAHLDQFIPDSGHGRFWKAVFAEVRAALSSTNSQPTGSK